MLVLIRTLLKYFPLMVSGLFYAIAVKIASRFVFRSSSLKSLFPILFMIKDASFTLNSTRPCFDYLIVGRSSSGFTSVPLLTLGISPFGPRVLA